MIFGTSKLHCERLNIGKIHGRRFYQTYTKLSSKPKVRRLGRKLGFSIPANAFRPRLSIAHAGTITVNGKCRIGANAARNLGISKSIGDIIAVLDSDDVWNKDYLMQHLDAHNDEDAVSSGYRFLEHPLTFTLFLSK